MDIRLKNTEAYLKSFADRLVKLTKISIGASRSRTYKSGVINSPLNSSGSLMDSISVENSSGSGFNIMGNEYADQLNDGRGSGNFPNIDSLVDWIKTKPVRLRDSRGKFVTATESKIKGLAFVIGRSIRDNGIQPTNFLTDIVNDEFDKLKTIIEPLEKDILLDLDNFMTSLGYTKKGETYELKHK